MLIMSRIKDDSSNILYIMPQEGSMHSDSGVVDLRHTFASEGSYVISVDYRYTILHSTYREC